MEVVDCNKPKPEHFFQSVQVLWITRHFPPGPAAFAHTREMTGTIWKPKCKLTGTWKLSKQRKVYLEKLLRLHCAVRDSENVVQKCWYSLYIINVPYLGNSQRVIKKKSIPESSYCMALRVHLFLDISQTLWEAQTLLSVWVLLRKRFLFKGLVQFPLMRKLALLLR